MSSLSDLQRDALTEIFNIGAGRAASSLSKIIDSEVTLSVPRIEFFRSSEINPASLSINGLSLATVKQSFTGPFETTAMLLFTEERTMDIVRDMMQSQLSVEELAEFEQEAMCELGNIILNSCMSALSDTFNFTLDSTLPTYSVETPEKTLQSISADTGLLMLLILHVDLIVKKRNSRGNLVFILSSSSFEELLTHVDQFIADI